MTDLQDQEITLDDLNHFWSREGLPVFYADRDDICDIVEAMGFSIYYLLAEQQTKVTPPANNNKHANNGKPTTSPAPTYKHETQWFKVVNNFVGRSVSKATPSLPDNFISVEELAHYKMPLIPHLIVDKLDQFFRLVDAQHGTESIVMLTYDMTKEGPEGWGILVPDQENTAAHCNYDPHSIAEIKPDDVMIVGSVHSHPHMSAYASGTDHADQADFDGIHITYGWQKSVNNGATQYHIELQMAGHAYTLKPEDVFEDFVVQKEPDPQVVEWTSKVKKELPPSIRTGGPASNSHSAHSQVTQHHPISLGTVLPSNSTYSELPWVSKLATAFSDCDVPYGSILVGEVNEVFPIVCPCCDSSLDHYSISDGYCDICLIPIVGKGSPRGEVIEAAANYAFETKISTDFTVYLLGSENDGTFFVIQISDKSLSDEIVAEVPEATLAVEEIKQSEEDYFKDITLCCGISLDDIDSCFCTPRLLHDDFLEYESIIRDTNIYDVALTNQCPDCVSYYSPACPAMKNFLVDFKNNPKEHVALIASSSFESITDTGCPNFEFYTHHREDIYDSLYYT